MELVRFQGVSKDYGYRPVLRDVSFRINAGEKIGLIGANGAGKTTIVNLLLGTDGPNGGVITRAPGLRIGHVPQYVDVAPGQTVIEVILKDHRRAEAALSAAQHHLADARPADIAVATETYDAALAAYQAAGGDTFEPRARGMLDALGLKGRSEQPVEQLSGGEKNVLSLAQALLAEPDLLVLDEPGNHLDFAALAWLERFLTQFRGAILVVSHNRYLLDRVVSAILRLHAGRIDAYAGNYSAYRSQELRDKLAQQADYVANQKRLAQLEELVRRFREIASARPDPAWGKRLRARVSQLERERAQAVERPEVETSPLRMRLSSKGSKADIALQVRGYTKAYGDLVLFEHGDIDIACGDRVALVGPNGSGKTTFVREVVEHGGWDDATIRVGPSLRVGYCAQNQELLDDRLTVLDQVLFEEGMTRQRAFDVLGRFLFGENDFDKRVGDLSGGERNRLQLALIFVRQPDFLILDEPTNHLDIPACEAIEDALADFKGTLLVISHDRYFLDKVAERVIEVRDRRFEPFVGNFSEFWAARAPALPSARARVSTRRQTRERKTPGPPHKARATPDATAGLRTLIEEAERERLALERRVSEAFTRGDHREGTRASHMLAEQQKRLDRLYAEWMAADG